MPRFILVENDNWDSFRLTKAISLLSSLSLVTRYDLNGSLKLSMHPLIHAWAKDRQGPEHQGAAWMTAGCVLAFNQSSTPMWMPNQRHLLPHVLCYLDMDIKRAFELASKETVVPILYMCGRALLNMRQDARLSRLLLDIFGEVGKDPEKASEEFLLLYELRARNLSSLRKPKKAIALLEQVIMIQGMTLGIDHLSRLVSQHVLAIEYDKNKQVKEAVELLKQLVEIDHPYRLESQHALALVYRDNGNVKEAIELLKQVVEIYRTTLAIDHPDLLASQHALAVVYYTNRQIKETIELLEQVVEIERKNLAIDDPERIAKQHLLAVAYKGNRQFKEAVELFGQVVRIQRTSLVIDDPDRVASEEALSYCLQQI